MVKSLQGTVCPCSTVTTVLSPGIFSCTPIQHLQHTMAVTMTVCCLPLTGHQSRLLRLHSLNCTQTLLLPFFLGAGDQIPIHIGAVLNHSTPLKNIMSYLHQLHIHHPNVISAFHLSSNCSFGTPVPSTCYPHAHMLLKGLCDLLCPQ